MPQTKKFGTFGGVFTPSILTILGVIMYLRFPAIIGQAGLLYTIAIVVVAHIISITTSLSVASLSTDKPVQNGGTYYMISRSLGLPIGGTLGYALFVGLSFSVSLYLIGFAESFLQYWEFGTSIQSVRLVGTLILMLVTAITFISTSLAIKSQYFIMAAIGLSLLSIAFGKHEFEPDAVVLAPLGDAVPFMVLFGIFFPAVTGFEAGVSMSGDLKNPKRSLPLGAMMAVGVGFIVYIGLAFFYAYTVDARVLADDPAVLFKIALVPELVIAGIWGATLSSALGSILGAPRILQAIAQDQIAPKVFAQTSSKNKEPRNALLLAFAIAEGGILIGQLDVIARIVSMFFITTYAFLNMASFIESWSSSDFRPAFKIPRWISLLGALSAFFVMILLDFMALAGATVVLALLYALLQRKQMVLNSGDAWGSFWANLAKRSLLRLSTHKIEQRNWRPNIIMFSVQDEHKNYLIETGLALTGKLGALTDFVLQVGRGKPAAEKPYKPSKNTSFFKRSYACVSEPEGIKAVTSVYGFSGFEPNTVLMEWSRKATKADELIALLKDFRQKKLNAVFLDYEGEAAFGKRQTIDVWWNGKGRHLNFSLHLLRFLLADKHWRDAQLRILFVDDKIAVFDRYRSQLLAILANQRMKAEVKLIQADANRTALAGIIGKESELSDLVLLGISDDDTYLSPSYISGLSLISAVKPSVLLLSPTDEFDELKLTPEMPKRSQGSAGKFIGTALPQIAKIEDETLRTYFELFNATFDELIKLADTAFLLPLIEENRRFAAAFSKIIDLHLKALGGVLPEPGDELHKIIQKEQQSFLDSVLAFFKKKQIAVNEAFVEIVKNGADELIQKANNAVQSAPQEVAIMIRKHSKLKRKQLHFQKVLRHYVNDFHCSVQDQLQVFIADVFQKKLDQLKSVYFSVDTVYNSLLQTKTEQEFSDLLSRFVVVKEQFEKQGAETDKLVNLIRKDFENIKNMFISDFADGIQTDRSLQRFHHSLKRKKDDDLSRYSENRNVWVNSFHCVYAMVYADSVVLNKRATARNIMLKFYEQCVAGVFLSIKEEIGDLSAAIENESVYQFELEKMPLLQSSFELVYKKIKAQINLLPEKVSVPEPDFVRDVQANFRVADLRMVNHRKVGLYYAESYFYENLMKVSASLDAEIQLVMKECQRASSFIEFAHLNSEKQDSPQSGQHVLQKQKERLFASEEKLRELFQAYSNHIATAVEELFSKLFTFSVVESEQLIPSYRRIDRNIMFTNIFKDSLSISKHEVIRFINSSVNSFSKAVLWTRRRNRAQADKPNLGDILDVVEELVPQQSSYGKLPLYYRKLFSQSSLLNDDLWVSRKMEEAELIHAFARHRHGTGGAVFVTGEYGSGKSALCRNFTDKLKPKHKIYWLDPPVGGSADLDTFVKKLSASTDMFADLDLVFESLPAGSLMVLHDVELWWEQAEGGTAVFERILDAVSKHGKRILFVIVCNSMFYDDIAMKYRLYLHTLLHLECGSFTAKQVKEMIMKRHTSSGLPLYDQHFPDRTISELKQSVLFGSIFAVSQGLPSSVIAVWQKCIERSRIDAVLVKQPTMPHAKLLKNIEPEVKSALLAFLFHRQMKIEKLSRVLHLSNAESMQLVQALHNAGVLMEVGENVYMIHSAVLPYVADICQK